MSSKRQREPGYRERILIGTTTAGLAAAALVGCSTGEAKPAPTVTVTVPASSEGITTPGALVEHEIASDQLKAGADIALSNLQELLKQLGGETSQRYNKETGTLFIAPNGGGEAQWGSLPGEVQFKSGDYRKNLSYAEVMSKKTINSTWETTITAIDIYAVYNKKGENLDDENIPKDEHSNTSQVNVTLVSEEEPDLQSVEALVRSLAGKSKVADFDLYTDGGGFDNEQTPATLQRAIDEIAAL